MTKRTIRTILLACFVMLSACAAKPIVVAPPTIAHAAPQGPKVVAPPFDADIIRIPSNIDGDVEVCVDRPFPSEQFCIPVAELRSFLQQRQRSH